MKKMILITLAITSFANAQIDDDEKDNNPLKSLYQSEKANPFADPLLEMDEEDDRFFDDLEIIHTPNKTAKSSKKIQESSKENAKKSK